VALAQIKKKKLSVESVYYFSSLNNIIQMNRSRFFVLKYPETARGIDPREKREAHMTMHAPFVSSFNSSVDESCDDDYHGNDEELPP